jgi:hypothetical protein
MMEETAICPICHVPVRQTDYFCYNCGHNLHPKPPSVGIVKQIGLYLGSVLFPPLGIFWAWPYIRQNGLKYKIIGLITIGLTVGSLVFSLVFVYNYVKEAADQASLELNRLQGF